LVTLIELQLWRYAPTTVEEYLTILGHGIIRL